MESDFIQYLENDEALESYLEDKAEKKIDEGLVEVLFRTIKTNTKINVSGELVYFRFELMSTKTFFTIRIKKKVLKSFIDWLNDIYEKVDEPGA